MQSQPRTTPDPQSPSAKVVLRARALGMCFGVRDALEVTRSIPNPADVTIHGELVHNPVVLDELQARGFVQVPEDDRAAPTKTSAVLITAHGVSRRERRRIAAQGVAIVDTTCPLVRKAHDRALALEREGYTVVVIGRRDHVEVRGIVEDLTRFVVVRSVAEVRRWGFNRIAVVAQTTTRPELAEAIVDAIAAHNPNVEVRWDDTICQPTKDRGEALEELLARVDALVVVGGVHSNNTRQLVQRAEARGIAARHVQGPGQVTTEWLQPFATIGITAGTSTLPETVGLVEQDLRPLLDQRGRGVER